MPVATISILAEENTLNTIRDGGNHLIGAAIACWQIMGMQNVASQCLQRPNERSRQLGIQQDFHAERGSMR